uniref:disks large-associated protein 5 n=1 Tax=Jaculus jaculus TaxID=51337 RepID=UPI001E1B36D4|nr:disks large-associated protein 5 [Jaculus jaculus]XP_045011201.1 disks large-associated protein 5 [Jaculus jaculus]
MSLSHFASRHRKDFSTEMIRTKIAHRKSLSQKENRYKEYERNRHFGLRDVNIPTLEGRVLVDLHETSQDLMPEKANLKPKPVKSVLSDERKQMLQKYKEEKQLQKLKEQREKAKRGVFKVGLYRPDAPGFLTNQKAMKTEPKKVIPSNVRITRSKAKDQVEQTKINNVSDVRAIQSGQRQTSEKKVLDKEKKIVQPAASSSVRATRSASQVTKQVVRTVSSATTRKPVTRATNNNEPEKKAPNKGRTDKEIEVKPDKVHCSKLDSVTNGLDLHEVLPKMENLTKTNPAKVKGKNSFAPKDFIFQPLDGLKTYQVAPMTPRSANAFLTPSYPWNPFKPEIDDTQEATKDTLAQACVPFSTNSVPQELSNPQCPLDSLTVCSEEHVLGQNGVTTKNSNCRSIEVTPVEVNEGQMSQPPHDVPYFRNILQTETEKLTSHCHEWDKKLELDIPDDAKDLIRTAVGQTRLLIKERFKQFEGLVDNCEYKRGEKETTCTDLDGFWDMVNFQVEDVHQKFNNLTKLEESGWQNNNTESKKVPRKKTVPGVANKPKQNDSGRIAARNRLAAIKNAMRERLKQEEHPEAAAAGIPKEVDTIVFDAGFFRVESPVRSFSALSSERHSQKFGTPKSTSKVMADSRTKMDLLPHRTPLETPDPQSNKREHVDVAVFPSVLKSSNSQVEDAQCTRLHELIEVNHDVNKMKLKMEFLPSERMSLPFVADGVADGINTNQKEAISDVEERMELNSSVSSPDVLMGSPEKNVPSQNDILQEVKVSQPVPLDESLTSECHLDSPGLSSSNLYINVDSRHQEHARNFSFGGNLIAFSPLRPFGGEQPGGF